MEEQNGSRDTQPKVERSGVNKFKRALNSGRPNGRCGALKFGRKLLPSFLREAGCLVRPLELGNVDSGLYSDG